MGRFLVDKKMGDELESIFKRIYSGGGESYGECIDRLLLIVHKLADTGLITNLTRRKMVTILTKEMDISEYQIVSYMTDEIAIVNTETHKADLFSLSGLIEWIVYELSNDSVMNKRLSGRNDYQGVIHFLNKHSLNNELITKKNWIDFIFVEDEVLFTQKIDKGITLFKMNAEKLQEDIFPFGTSEEVEMVKITEGLLDGIIYSDSEKVFVNLCNGFFAGLSSKSDFDVCEGQVLHILDKAVLIVKKESMVYVVDEKGNYSLIINGENARVLYKSETELYWKIFNEDGFIGNSFCYSSKNRMIVPKICKEVIWYSLLHLLYDFRWNYTEKISDRLVCYDFFEETPRPFTISEIMKKLNRIERFEYDGLITQNSNYVKVMSALINIEKMDTPDRNILELLESFIDSVGDSAILQLEKNECECLCDYFNQICYYLNKDSTGTLNKYGRLSDYSLDNDFDIDRCLTEINRRIAELEKEERGG